MTNFFTSFATVAAVALAPVSAVAQQDWTPPGPIKMLIGFAAGGGADTQARLIAQGIEEKFGWTVIPEQATGNSGLSLAAQLMREPDDGTAIGMVVSETLTYSAIAAGNPDLQLENFTPLATTAAFQLGLVAMQDGAFDSWQKVVDSNAAGQDIRFATASDRQADMAYHLGQKTGINFNIVQVQGGAGVMNGLRGGDVDIGWVAGAQAQPVQQGEMTNIARGIEAPLEDTPDALSIVELGSEFYLDGYFMFIAPAGLSEDARAALAGAIEAVLTDPETEAHALVTKGFGGPAVVTGDALDAYMSKSHNEAQQLIDSVSN